MPLVKSKLESGILSLQNKIEVMTDAVQAKQKFASGLATIIDSYVKSAS